MHHYILTVPVDYDDVQIIKEQLQNYVQNAGIVAIHVTGNVNKAPSEELQGAIQSVFMHLMHTLVMSDFERIQ